MRIFKKLTIIAAITALLGAHSALALTASQSVLKEVVVTQSDGSTDIEYQDASLVTPGETVLYRLNYENDSSEPASDIVLVMPVPEVITYIEGSAEAEGTSVVYSADEGKTFTTRGKLRISSSGDNSEIATAEDITHIRWTIENPIEAGAKGVLSFKGILK